MLVTQTTQTAQLPIPALRRNRCDYLSKKDSTVTLRRLEGMTAVITGAAAGIGRAISTTFAAEGATVIVCDIDAEGGEQTAALARETTPQSHFVELDVSDERAWVGALKTVNEANGAPDILVNNAGLPYRRSLRDSDFAEWQSLLTVNAGGTFLGMKHAAAVMAEGGGGAIVNVASAAALRGVSGMVSYSAGKGAIRAMTRSAAMEYAEAGVRINSLYPTSVPTAMAESDARDSNVSPSEFLEAAAAMSPLEGIAEPHDVAVAALFLASDEARFITGAELVIDGGATAVV